MDIYVDVAAYGNNMVRTVFDINSSFGTKRSIEDCQVNADKIKIQDEEYGK
jgi:hypothetical protein